MSGINWLDLIVIAFVLIFALKGLSSGLIREVFGIIGMIGGFIFAIKFKAEVGAWISANIYDLNKLGLMGSNGTEIVVGFIATLFGIWFVALVLGEILTKMLSLSGLGIVDRIGGFVFGGAKIFLIFAIIAVFIRSSAFLNKQARPFFEKSFTYPYLINTGAWMMGLKLNDIIPVVEDEVIQEANQTNIVYEKSDFNQTVMDENLTNGESNETKTQYNED